MKKLTQDQKQYRKRKKEAKKDFIRVKNEHGEISLRVAKRSLCLRVSEEVFNALTVISEAYGKDKGEMIGFMIGNSIHNLQTLPGPKYKYHSDGLCEYQPSTDPSKPRLNGTGGEKQINVRISSTAWKKLDDFCGKDQKTRYSKKRVVEQLIFDYVKRNSQEL
jgi:hypothetical protein